MMLSSTPPPNATPSDTPCVGPGHENVCDFGPVFKSVIRVWPSITRVKCVTSCEGSTCIEKVRLGWAALAGKKAWDMCAARLKKFRKAEVTASCWPAAGTYSLPD